jgi:ring-1,2-phenylacetyl-CoA epoxidase subunit PaaE
MPAFHELEIAEVKSNTKQAVLIEFTIPDHLKEKFQFQPGQHVILDFKLERNKYSRTYSICTAPLENKLCISVKRQNKGIISNYINDAFFRGFKVNVSEPFGNFYMDGQVAYSSMIVLWAGGSGITPMISIAKNILQSFQNKKVKLVYANNHENSIMFENEIEKLEKQYEHHFSVDHILSGNNTPDNFISKLFSIQSRKRKHNGLSGYITKDLIKSITNQFPNAVHYICGPEKMMELCESSLKLKDSDPVYLERFVGTSTLSNSNKNAILKVSLSKKHHEINLGENNLLDAMLGAKLNPPYACKTGTCGSCKVKLVSGEVIVARDFALNEADREAGKILCCQSWAKSAEIEIAY